MSYLDGRYVYGEERERGNLDRMTPIIAINMHTGEMSYYKSQGLAARILGMPQANIWKVMNKQRLYAGGYIFKEACHE